MQAFHNDQKVKDKYLARVRAHQKADEIIKGQYWTEDGKGCAVGCTIHGSNHSAYETEIGVPRWLARVEDRIFEGLPIEEAKKWPAKFLSAITPGQDLEKIKIPFLIFVVESARENFDHKKYPKQLAAIDNVLTELRKTPIDNAKMRSYAAAAAADYAAYAAADYAAYAAYAAAAADDAAYAAADYAAYAAYAAAAADDAAYAAAAAADAAYAAAAARKTKAYENTWIKFADKVLELIEEHK